MKPPKPCIEAGCPLHAPAGKSRCRAHEAQWSVQRRLEGATGHRGGWGNWRRVRDRILRRDNFTCRDCNSRYGDLQVHHVNFNSGDNRDHNLVTLCPDCHMGRHVARREATPTIHR